MREKNFSRYKVYNCTVKGKFFTRVINKITGGAREFFLRFTKSVQALEKGCQTSKKKLPRNGSIEFNSIGTVQSSIQFNRKPPVQFKFNHTLLLHILFFSGTALVQKGRKIISVHNCQPRHFCFWRWCGSETSLHLWAYRGSKTPGSKKRLCDWPACVISVFFLVSLDFSSWNIKKKVGRRASASSHRYQKFCCVLAPGRNEYYPAVARSASRNSRVAGPPA